MRCKLCGSNFVGNKCSVCGLPKYENYGEPVISLLTFGKHKGMTIQQVYNSDPGYLTWMVRQGAGTETQKSYARMLLSGNQPIAQMEVADKELKDLKEKFGITNPTPPIDYSKSYRMGNDIDVKAYAQDGYQPGPTTSSQVATPSPMPFVQPVPLPLTVTNTNMLLTAPKKPKWYNTTSGRVMVVILGFVAIMVAAPVWSFLKTPKIAPDKLNAYAVLAANSHVFNEPKDDSAIIETTGTAGVIYIVRETTGLEFYERAGGGWVKSGNIHFYNTEGDALTAIGQPPAQIVSAQSAYRITSESAPCYEGQIKGNNNSGIYHVPGQSYYSVTNLNVTCFNTEAEAQAAKFRKSKV